MAPRRKRKKRAYADLSPIFRRSFTAKRTREGGGVNRPATFVAIPLRLLAKGNRAKGNLSTLRSNNAISGRLRGKLWKLLLALLARLDRLSRASSHRYLRGPRARHTSRGVTRDEVTWPALSSRCLGEGESASDTERRGWSVEDGVRDVRDRERQ
jgi:hypothetical protein